MFLLSGAFSCRGGQKHGVLTVAARHEIFCQQFHSLTFATKFLLFVLARFEANCNPWQFRCAFCGFILNCLKREKLWWRCGASMFNGAGTGRMLGLLLSAWFWICLATWQRRAGCHFFAPHVQEKKPLRGGKNKQAHVLQRCFWGCRMTKRWRELVWHGVWNLRKWSVRRSLPQTIAIKSALVLLYTQLLLWGPVDFQIQNAEPHLALLGPLPPNLDLVLHSISGKDTTADEEKGGGVNSCTSPLGFSLSFQAFSLLLQVCASTTCQCVYTVAILKRAQCALKGRGNSCMGQQYPQNPQRTAAAGSFHSCQLHDTFCGA